MISSLIVIDPRSEHDIRRLHTWPHTCSTKTNYFGVTPYAHRLHYLQEGLKHSSLIAFAFISVVWLLHNYLTAQFYCNLFSTVNM